MSKSVNTDDLHRTRTIGQRLRSARLAAGLTQEQIGKSLGVTFQQIQKYENGKNRVTITTLERTCEFLGITVASLLADGPFQQAMNPIFQDDPLDRQLVAEVAEITSAFMQISDPTSRTLIRTLINKLIPEGGKV